MWLSTSERQAVLPKTGVLDTLQTHSHNGRAINLADVAELADAQVSEACDGDIVEVQVLSSAPKTPFGEPRSELPIGVRRFFLLAFLGSSPLATKKSCHGTYRSGVLVLRGQSKRSVRKGKF